jgi:hypothetical protein
VNKVCDHRTLPDNADPNKEDIRIQKAKHRKFGT